MRISDWSSDVCSSDLLVVFGFLVLGYLAYTLPLADPTRPERRMSLLLYTSSGEPFGSRGIFRGAPLTFEEIPKVMVDAVLAMRSEEHTSELQSLMRISYAVFCLKTKNIKNAKKLLYTLYDKQQDMNKR